MKRKFTLIVLIIIALISCKNSIAQTKVVCGTDSVFIKLDNYINGRIQWQQSNDSLTWTDILNANDTVLKVFTSNQTYYRAEITFSNCDQIYSSMTFVNQIPQSIAGIDRSVYGTSVTLNANIPVYCKGIWTIFNGTGGIFTNLTNPKTEFTGITGNTYKLSWILTNSCGSSTDTMNVKFMQNEYSGNIIIVDTTDILLSSKTDSISGVYKIQFSDSIPNINDSCVLIGMVGNGFLRKAQKATFNAKNTYTFQTIQGTLEDICKSGVLNLGQAFNINKTLDSTKSNKSNYLDYLPTRKELLTDPKFKTGTYIFKKGYKTKYAYGNIKMEKDDKDGVINIVFPQQDLISTDNCTLYVDGYYKLTPNFVADAEFGTILGVKNYTDLKYMNIGVNPAVSELNLGVHLIASGEETLAETEMQLFQASDPIWVILPPPAWPIEITANVDLNATYDLTVSGEAAIDYSETYTNYISAGIIYNNGFTYYFANNHDKQESLNVNLKCDEEQDLTLEPKLSFYIFNVAGPFVSLPISANQNLCFDLNNGNFSWDGNIKESVDFTIGVEPAGWLKKIIDPYSQSFNIFNAEMDFPANIQEISGNNQTGDAGQQLTEPVQVKVTSNNGMSIPFVPVNFAITGNNGSVDKQPVFTDLSGIARCNWTLGTSGDENELTASVDDCQGENIGNSPLIFKAYANQTNKCENSSLALGLKYSDNGSVQTYGIKGNPPYEYSQDGTNYSTTPIVLQKVDKTYTLYVEDVNGCKNSKTISPTDPCINANIQGQITTNGSVTTITASGGTAPYQYSLDNKSNFQSNNVYQNLAQGSHIIYIEDNNGCVSGFDFTIQNTPPPITGQPCPDLPIIKDIDGNVYNTVSIGTQCWMQKNLATTRYNDGSGIPLVTDNTAWYNLSTPGYCWYNNDYADYGSIYGALYNWYAVNTGKLCPVGWHVPSYDEWNTLINYLGGESVAGEAMKSTILWQPYTGIINTNSSGFSALPGGYRDDFDGFFDIVGIYGGWWSATEYDASGAWGILLYFNNPDALEDVDNGYGFSVRCLRD